MRKSDEIEAEKHEAEVEIEHNHHDEIDKIRDCTAREECPKPETPDWHHGTTGPMDVDCQNAFDNIDDDSGSILISEDDDATPGHWFGKLGFLSSCLGYAVFLGNIWRYLCYRNDSGISLISYVLILFFCNSCILLFVMEFWAVCQLNSHMCMEVQFVSSRDCVGYVCLVPSSHYGLQ